MKGGKNEGETLNYFKMSFCFMCMRAKHNVSIKYRDVNIPRAYPGHLTSLCAQGGGNLADISGWYWGGVVDTTWEGYGEICSSCLEIMVKLNTVLRNVAGQRKAFESFVLCLKVNIKSYFWKFNHLNISVTYKNSTVGHSGRPNVRGQERITLSTVIFHSGFRRNAQV